MPEKQKYDKLEFIEYWNATLKACHCEEGECPTWQSPGTGSPHWSRCKQKNNLTAGDSHGPYGPRNDMVVDALSYSPQQPDKLKFEIFSRAYSAVTGTYYPRTPDETHFPKIMTMLFENCVT